MSYKLSEHGDPIEKKYFNFIDEQIFNYIKLWELYIGNIGNDKMGFLEVDDQENQIIRQNFSENIYTVLISTILIHKLVSTKFSTLSIDNIEDRLMLENDIVLFFALVGRVYDNVEAASQELYKIDNRLQVTNVTKKLEEFYNKRHVIVHGKTTPSVVDSEGKILIPILYEGFGGKLGWKIKSNWEDILVLPTEYAENSINQIYWSLLAKINAIFDDFYEIIKEYLECHSLVLRYDRSHEGQKTMGSGSMSV